MMTRDSGSLAWTSAIMALVGVLTPLAGCAIAGPEGVHLSDCENRGYTPGTAAYNRCLVRQAQHREYIRE